MSKLCGHCSKKIPTVYTPLMIWCKTEKMFVCGHCWNQICRSGHGKRFWSKGWHPFKTFLIVTFLTSMIWSFAVLGVTDIYLRYTWSNLENTKISNPNEDSIIKLEGIIDGNQTEIVISGHEYKSGSSFDWRWNNNETFYLTNSTDSIKISTKKYYEIEKGLHPAPNKDKTSGTVYRGGDEVTIIGEVKSEEDSQLIYLLWIGPKNTEINIPTLSYLMSIVGLLLIGFGYFIVLGQYRIRNKLHNVKISSSTPVDIEKNDFQEPHNLDWRRNGLFSRTIYGILIGLLFLIALILLFIINFSNNNLFHSYNDYLNISLLNIPIFLFMFSPILYYYEKVLLKPDKIAISVKGIHYFFKNNILTNFQFNFIGWDEIKDIKSINYRGEFTSDWVIDRIDGSHVSINNLTKKNKQLIVNKFKEIRNDKIVN